MRKSDAEVLCKSFRLRFRIMLRDTSFSKTAFLLYSKPWKIYMCIALSVRVNAAQTEPRCAALFAVKKTKSELRRLACISGKNRR